ncbi:Uncharacterised protein [Mycobacterium tuberculosis]|uniref:Uncharacterized protein n=1 Tax=Mycobacterium tuberculosis TaxID=1773 RepID=A0A916PBL6_MYCTX|nr:Uncharacterised protein [Mycobacterium tuberculosis]COY38558.1 Uncharacterised protein [Mycobacterium tuberculosis]CPA11569.1 Uncharacterised protein [Mycobacterium tuberculosis]
MPVSALTHTSSFTVFQRFRSTRSDGFAVWAPVARHAWISAFSCATVQL